MLWVECCLYPAQALYDGDYGVDDLPDAVVATNSRGSHVLTKDGYGGGVSGFQPIIDGAIYGNDDPNEDETVVTLQEGSQGIVWRRGSGLGDKSNACLITEIEPVNNGIEDQFADTYIISGPISGAVTRESICVWRGSNLRLTNFGFQWKVNGNNKSGFQNTPVGSYAGGFTVS